MESFAQISQAIFRDYIRSAVIIDDQWPEHEVVINDAELDESDLIADSEEDDEPDIAESGLTGKATRPRQAPSVEELDVEILGGLRRALLREGVLTCGLRYQQEYRRTAIELARRADIVVLDWDLGSGNGDEALKILKELQGDSLRFVCIYTHWGRLEEVREILIENLSSAETSSERAWSEHGKDDFGNLVIAFRGKKGLVDESVRAVDPENFLEDAIGGLTKNFGGLVQLAMLEMTQRHREHLPRILEHIGSSIDTAVLLEAGDRDSPVGPGGAFLGVLVDEWRSRLERDHAQLKSLSREGRRAFGAKLRSNRGENWPMKMEDHLVQLGTKPKVAKKCSEAVSAGFDRWLDEGCGSEFPEVQGVTPKIAAWTALCSSTEDDAPLDSLLRLDALFHQQFNPANSLTQGAVVRVQDGDMEHHLICTTPLYDSAQPKRIGGLYTFVRARKVPTEKVLRGGGAEWYCVIGHDGEYFCLKVLVKERVSLEVWDPSFDEDGIVHACFSIGGGKEPSREQVDVLDLHRVAQLRFEHALALSAAAATDAARVGVNRVELIRSR
ncbi:MAG: hypothetical protein GY854_26065, partial [Deltaproteobacteria bacterium]|nr:hypothetical protein [Deltaproteobacteria bacterium]